MDEPAVRPLRPMTQPHALPTALAVSLWRGTTGDDDEDGEEVHPDAMAAWVHGRMGAWVRMDPIAAWARLCGEGRLTAAMQGVLTQLRGREGAVQQAGQCEEAVHPPAVQTQELWKVLRDRIDGGGLRRGVEHDVLEVLEVCGVWMGGDA